MRLSSLTALVLLSTSTFFVQAVELRVIDVDPMFRDFAVSPSGEAQAQTVELSSRLLANLASQEIGAVFVLRGFPIAPSNQIATIEIERIELYAPDATVFVNDGKSRTQIPRSDRVHYLGFSREDPELRIGLSLDAAGKELRGLVASSIGTFTLRPSSTAPLRAASSALEIGAIDRSDDPRIETSCQTPGDGSVFVPAEAIEKARTVRATRDATHTAVVAFDTDGEFIQDYFSGSTTNANNAIGDFLTAANVLYERDLGMRLLQGHTELRSTIGAPYTSSSTGTQLGEVGGQWSIAPLVNESRVFVALLSGKGFLQGNSCGGSGIAWVDSYCTTQSSGGSYSATQMLRCIDMDHPSNVSLLGHEIGHNAGSTHTHCYIPEVDQCYADGGGSCYSGTESCPDHTGEIPGISVNKGTIMSYCNFPNAGCGNNDPYFHPIVSARIIQSRDANTNGSCVSAIPVDADLSITKTESEDPAWAGTGLVYTITVSNAGPADASNVSVIDVMPVGLSFDSTSGCSEDPVGEPTCSLGTISAGSSASYTLTTAISSAASGSITNDADASTTSSESSLANNSASATTTIVTPAGCDLGSLSLDSSDLGSASLFMSEASISAANGFAVQNGEDIEFRAAIDIALDNGFTVESGGDLAAVLDPLISCP